MSSKYARKRKQLDEDTSEVGKSRRDSSRSPSPPRSKKQAKTKEPEDNGEPAESMSIEETNKLRASLGLAPLEQEESKVREADDGTNEKIYNEDGFEFRHRKADNWADKKKETALKEKLEVAKAKRDVYSKVLKAKKLADSDEEDNAASFVEKMRQKEEEAKKAAERAKAFDQLDEELGVSALMAKEKKQKKPKKPKGPSDTAGMVIGHGREAFVEGDQILVLQDKGVLDDGDEVLVNPNLLDDERHVRNVELRKRKDPHRNFDEDVDEFGNLKNFGVLAKYDETLEGEQKKQFRLDDKGGVDLDEERREMEEFKKMKMKGKRLESLDTKKYQLASEFYTQDEMVQFRKVKKGKKEKNIRKRKVLKASDLVPVEAPGEGSKSRDFGRRRRDSDDADADVKNEDLKQEEGEISDKEPEESDGKWKTAMRGTGVDLERLQKLRAQKARNDEDEDSDDDLMFTGGVDLTGVVIDDDAEEELSAVLAKTRKVKQVDAKNLDDDVGKRVQSMLSTHGVKMEDEDEDVKPVKDGSLFIDSTTEYCRHVGEITTLGLGGNRAVDISELKNVKEEEMDSAEKEEKEGEGFEKWKRAKVDKELRERERMKMQEKGGWLAAGKPVPLAKIDSDDEEALDEAKKRKWSDDEEDEEDDEYAPALGREVDVSKGVGQMLKLAGQKGYLTNPNAKSVNGPSLDHLKNKACQKIDASRFDPDDRNAKKADRLASQSRGPTVPFNEKVDYKPDVNISYVDKKGREMDAKDAYRELSYKFHGRNPGKKQLEKRANRKDKEERMLKTNSYDTPLGTLSKQLKKQKQLSTPYLVLSGSNDHSSLKKE